MKSFPSGSPTGFQVPRKEKVPSPPPLLPALTSIRLYETVTVRYSQSPRPPSEDK